MKIDLLLRITLKNQALLVKRSKLRKVKKSKKSKKKHRKARKSNISKTSNMKYNIEYQTNNDLVINDKALNSYFKYDKCSKISGVLGYVNQRPKASNNNTIKILPIYISINQETLNLFISFDTSTLFKSVTLDAIARVDINYPRTNCFDLIIHFVDGENLNIGPLTLCAKNLNAMKDWITAILQIKECKLKHPIHQGMTLIDFNAMNELKKTQIKEKAEKVKGLSYSNKKTVNQSRFVSYQQQQIQKTMKSIIDSIKKGRLARNMLRRRFKGKFQKVRGITNTIYSKENLMSNIMEKRSLVEKRKEARLLSIEHQTKQLRILKNIKKENKKFEGYGIKRLQKYSYYSIFIGKG